MNWTFEWLYHKPSIERSILPFQDVMLIQKIVSKDIKGVMGRLIPNKWRLLPLYSWNGLSKQSYNDTSIYQVPSHKHTTGTSYFIYKNWWYETKARIFSKNRVNSKKRLIIYAKIHYCPLVEFHLIGRFLISQWHRDWSILAQFRFSNILLCNEGLDQVYPHHLDCLIVIYTVVYHTLGLLASKYYGCQISKVVFNSHTCTWLFFFLIL